MLPLSCDLPWPHGIVKCPLDAQFRTLPEVGHPGIFAITLFIYSFFACYKDVQKKKKQLEHCYSGFSLSSHLSTLYQCLCFCLLCFFFVFWIKTFSFSIQILIFQLSQLENKCVYNNKQCWVDTNCSLLLITNYIMKIVVSNNVI